MASGKNVTTTYADAGGYLIFGRGSTPLLVTAATKSRVRQAEDGAALWNGVFDMEATDSAAGQRVRWLHDAEFIQILFKMLEPGSHVLSGRAIVTINNAVRLEFQIPSQIVDNENRLFIRDLRAGLAPLN